MFGYLGSDASLSEQMQKAQPGLAPEERNFLSFPASLVRLVQDAPAALCVSD